MGGHGACSCSREKSRVCSRERAACSREQGTVCSTELACVLQQLQGEHTVVLPACSQRESRRTEG